ncbi:hypothetical protein DFP72DRAFT_1060831 [Ephemerocybe angulata]|uniref:Uncharacterized protein n=1 Tax=Ephemerocybe angulata TaxID=980116 RepID=A0A8H6ICJ3_9AGAR|nr:hypothetical protein DFP72DRAFT_1060831 [Tulosesus angulatus]
MFPPLPTTDSPASTEVLRPERRPSYPASVHFAFVSGILLPLAVIPYLLSRRQTTRLRNHLKHTDRMLRMLQQELKFTTIELNQVKAQQTKGLSEMKRVHGLVEELDQRSGKLQADGVQGQKALLEYVVKLERELEASSASHTSSIREVGRSLGTVAGFMHELELGLGLGSRGRDGRGIERLRAAAARLEQGDSKADKKS